MEFLQNRCAVYYRSMGYNARNDEIRDNFTRMRREWEAQRGALATVRRFKCCAFRQRLCLVLA